MTEFPRSDKALFHIGKRASEQLADGKWRLRDDVGVHVLKQTPMPLNFDRMTTEIENVAAPVLSIVPSKLSETMSLPLVIFQCTRTERS